MLQEQGHTKAGSKLTETKPSLIWGVFIGFASLTWIGTLLIGFNGLYGQDAHEYLRYTQELTAWIGSGVSPGKFFWPVNYPFWGAILGSVVGSLLVGLQLLSLLALGIVPVLLYLILRVEAPHQHDLRLKLLYCLVFCAAAPFFWRSGTLIMSDAFAIGWLMLFYYAYWNYVKEGGWRFLLVLGIGAVAAVMTRYALALLVLLPGIHVLLIAVKRRQLLALLGAGVLSLLFTLPHLLIRLAESFDFLGHSYLQGWSWKHWFMRSFSTNDGVLSFRLPNLLYAFGYWYHPGFFSFGILGVAFVRWRTSLSTPKRILLGSIVVYSLFIAGIPFQNQRFLLPLLPLSLVFWYPVFYRIIQWLDNLKAGLKWVVLGVVVLIQAFLFIHYSKPMWWMNRQEQHIAQAVSQYPANTLYCFYYDGALRSYQCQHELVNLWHDPITAPEVRSLVLFHPSRFQRQWEGHTLMDNWQRLQQEYNLEVLEELPNGWRLYQIKSQNESDENHF